MMLSSRYLDFEYDASQLIKFIAAGDFFSCMLKTGDIIHYTPTNPDLFLQWLVAHDIENIRRIERDTFN
ncbi:hypothetical protein GWR56_14040 [Mucilaginibacter sp. 14171R-50]|uniref:hypothetical protein n=1 Tax=Mucilaginibacter sp. 14171R-50 TaxID=2703789 RepID=UPI00138B81A8|nr:hypothetical protein [Mucilaginibacter sp. 14171R-50]QHS56609.1 hypothetical protein GWR56_14040 [Mucilaginibacter sp. 14171R-50]